MPPKRSRGWGLEYHSSEDEDYLPPGSPPQPLSTSKSRRNATKQQQQDQEEDIPLSQRQHTLQQGKKRTTSTVLTPLDETTGLPLGSSLQNFKFEVPEEVLHNILSHFCKNSGAIPSAAIALCINKAWRSAVLSYPELWEYVDLSFGWCRPTNTIIETYSLKWIALQELSLEGCSPLTETALIALAENCPKLHSLNLSHCTGFRETGLADALCSMLSRPLNENSSPLRDLDLSFIQIAPKGSGLDTVLRRILMEQANNPTEGPVLETLLVAGCPMLSHRPFKAVYDASVVAEKPLLGALKTLSLDGSAGLSSDFTLNIVRFQLAAPNLRSLHLCHVARALGWQASISSAGLPVDLVVEKSMWTELRTLRITAKCYSSSENSSNIDYLSQMLRNAPSLEEIALIGFRQVYIDDLMELFSEYTATGQPRKGLTRLMLDGTYADDSYFLQGTAGDPSFYRLFADSTWMRESLEELSVARSRHGFTNEVCEELARYYPNLIEIDARETAITEEGVRILVESAQRRGLLNGNDSQGRMFSLNIDSCRSVDRKIRQAASRSIHDLVQALGL